LNFAVEKLKAKKQEEARSEVEEERLQEVTLHPVLVAKKMSRKKTCENRFELDLTNPQPRSDTVIAAAPDEHS
jgi:hypothetical protein